jgi:hypothetical protein
MNATSTPGAATAPLTRSDRCDRCPAAAIMRAVLGEAGELLFCGHHAREHGPRLHALGAGLSIGLTESHSAMGPRVPGDLTPEQALSWVRQPG